MEYKLNDYGIICNPNKNRPDKAYLIFCNGMTEFKDYSFFEVDQLVIDNRLLFRNVFNE